MNDVILIGRKQPKRIYRIVVQERKSIKSKTEKARSFMIKDYVGNTDIDKIKRMLKDNIKTEVQNKKSVGRPRKE